MINFLYIITMRSTVVLAQYLVKRKCIFKSQFHTKIAKKDFGKNKSTSTRVRFIKKKTVSTFIA